METWKQIKKRIASRPIVVWDAYGPMDPETGEAEWIGSVLAKTKEIAIVEAQDLYGETGLEGRKLLYGPNAFRHMILIGQDS